MKAAYKVQDNFHMTQMRALLLLLSFLIQLHGSAYVSQRNERLSNLISYQKATGMTDSEINGLWKEVKSYVIFHMLILTLLTCSVTRNTKNRKKILSYAPY